MEVQVEDDKDYFNNVHKALITLQATNGNKIISYAADLMDAAPQPRSNQQSNIASTGPPPRERHRNRGDTLKRNLASGTATLCFITHGYVSKACNGPPCGGGVAQWMP